MMMMMMMMNPEIPGLHKRAWIAFPKLLYRFILTLAENGIITAENRGNNLTAPVPN